MSIPTPLRAYLRRFGTRRTVGADLKAGLTLGVESVPDGLAAGVLAGVNPLFGLNAYLVGTLAGAFATGSVFMSVQATGAMAVILEDVPQVRGPGAAGAMAMLTVLTGLIMLGLGLAPARLAGAVHPDRGAHRIRQRCGGQHRAGTARQRHRLRQ